MASIQLKTTESPTKKFKANLPNNQLTITQDDVSIRSSCDDTETFQGDLGELMRKNTGKSIIVMSSFINNEEDIEKFKEIKLLERIGEGGEGIV